MKKHNQQGENLQDMTKVIFKELPHEPFLQRLWRLIRRKYRINEYVALSINGRTKVYPRGVAVFLPMRYLELADKMPTGWGYEYEIII